MAILAGCIEPPADYNTAVTRQTSRMTAESEALSEQIKQSVALLRRHL
jgi:hypothetical protein